MKGADRTSRRTLTTAMTLLAFAGVIAVVGLLRARSRSGDAASGGEALTAAGALSLHPSFSPDGTGVAFGSDRTGRFEIYVKELGGERKETAVTSDGHQNLQPSWSPDGTRLAYHSKERGGIWVVPVASSPRSPLRLTSFGSSPSWSPDGSLVAFQSDPLLDLGATAVAAMPPSAIWVVPSAGGSPVRITRPGWPAGGHGSPVWSMDGRRIAFVSCNPPESELWSVAASGADLAEAVVDGRTNSDPAYSPDGRWLYYLASADRLTQSLYRVAVTSGTGRPRGQALPVEGLGDATYRHLAISPDGREIALSRIATNSQLLTIPVAGGSGEASGPPRSLTSGPGRKAFPAFSPDGGTIAFNVWLPGQLSDLWITDADGTPSPLTTNPADDFLPSWFPDGKALLFLSNRDKHSAFWTLSLADRKETMLISLRKDNYFSRLSPDGKQIAFHAKESGAENVWVLDVAEGEPRQVTFDKEFVGFPCWSPDGKALAVELKRGAATQIGVLDVVPPAGGPGGSPVIPLTTREGQSWPYSWSPDGDRIAFAGFRDGLWNVFWVSRSTREERRVTSFAKLSAYVRYPEWSPRGDQIVFEYAETTGTVWRTKAPR